MIAAVRGRKAEDVPAEDAGSVDCAEEAAHAAHPARWAPSVTCPAVPTAHRAR